MFFFQGVWSILYSQRKKKLEETKRAATHDTIQEKTFPKENNFAIPIHHDILFPLKQLSRRATNRQLARLLDLGLENHLVPILPHLGHQGLAGKHGTSEPDLDVLELAKLLIDGLAGNTKEAQAVKDGHLEPAHLCEGGINVQGVVITAQPVKRGLLLGSLLLDNKVGSPSGGLVGRRRGAAVLWLLLSIESTASAKEDGHLVVEDFFARLSVGGGDTLLNDGGVALIHNLEELALRDELSGSRDGILLDLQVLLTVEKHHGREVGDEVVKGIRELGVEGGDDTKSRNDLEVLGTLENVVKLVALGADAEVVKHNVALGVCELGALALGLERLLLGFKVLV